MVGRNNSKATHFSEDNTFLLPNFEPSGGDNVVVGGAEACWEEGGGIHHGVMVRVQTHG